VGYILSKEWGEKERKSWYVRIIHRVRLDMNQMLNSVTAATRES
jgi:hypothetical protein